MRSLGTTTPRRPPRRGDRRRGRSARRSRAELGRAVDAPQDVRAVARTSTRRRPRRRVDRAPRPGGRRPRRTRSRWRWRSAPRRRSSTPASAARRAPARSGPTSSAARCWACEALPPFPNQKTVPPACTQTSSRDPRYARWSAPSHADASHHRLVLVELYRKSIAFPRRARDRSEGSAVTSTVRADHGVVLLDRDGVLNVDRAESVTSVRRARGGAGRAEGRRCSAGAATRSWS